MAFGRKNRNEINEAATEGIPIAPTKALPERKTSAMKVMDAIKAGGATEASLMELIEAKNKSSLYGQLSYLNTRGLNAYEALTDIGQEEAANAAQNFPIKGENGVYYMGTYAQFVDKKVASAPKRPTKVYTPAQMGENAQKRWDKANKSAVHQRKVANDNPGDAVYALRADIADKSLELVTLLLEAVQGGNYEYERGNVAE